MAGLELRLSGVSRNSTVVYSITPAQWTTAAFDLPPEGGA